jgi:hypothetical protein
MPAHVDDAVAEIGQSAPPIPGAPWLRLEPLAHSPPQQLTPAGPRREFLTEVRQGPPVPGAPWTAPHETTPPAARAAPSARRPRPDRLRLARVPLADRRLQRFTEIVSLIVNSLVDRGHLQAVQDVTTAQGAQPVDWLALSGAIPAAQAPTALDDSSTGAVQGALWVDTSAARPAVYVCASATPDGAVWVQVTPHGLTGKFG